jgi:hypothetical protein
MRVIGLSLLALLAVSCGGAPTREVPKSPPPPAPSQTLADLALLV